MTGAAIDADEAFKRAARLRVFLGMSAGVGKTYSMLKAAHLRRLEGFDVVIVDELAHTNFPGSRHAKRYQDVLELLDAGIDVFTAVNVQSQWQGRQTDDDGIRTFKNSCVGAGESRASTRFTGQCLGTQRRSAIALP